MLNSNDTPLLQDELPELSRREIDNRRLVAANGLSIRNIDNPSEEVQMLATSSNGRLIRYIDNPSEQVQLNAIKNSIYAFEAIQNPSTAAQLMATAIDGNCLRCIQNPCVEVQKTAISQHGAAIRFIRSPAEEIQLLAVGKSGYHLTWIQQPTLTVIARAIEKTPKIVFDPDFAVIITPQVLEQIQPGISASIEHIQSLVEDRDAWPELLAAVFKPVDGQGENPSDENAGVTNLPQSF